MGEGIYKYLKHSQNCDYLKVKLLNGKCSCGLKVLREVLHENGIQDKFFKRRKEIKLK